MSHDTLDYVYASVVSTIVGTVLIDSIRNTMVHFYDYIRNWVCRMYAYMTNKHCYKLSYGTDSYGHIDNRNVVNIMNAIMLYVRERTSKYYTATVTAYDGINLFYPLEYVSVDGYTLSCNVIQEDQKSRRYEMDIYTSDDAVAFDKFIKQCKDNFDLKRNIDAIDNQMFIHSDGVYFIRTDLCMRFNPDHYITPERAVIDRYMTLLNTGRIGRLNILAYGEHGTGKTTIGKYIAKQYNMCPIIVNINQIESPEQLNEILFSKTINICGDRDSYVVPIKKRLYIFEDIDCVGNIVHERAAVDKKTDDDDGEKMSKYGSSVSNNTMVSKLTLSNILNTLDGINELPGAVMLFTTNYINKLDSALCRPGRMNLRLHVKRLPIEYVRKILCGVYGNDIVVDDTLDGKLTLAMLTDCYVASDTYAECCARINEYLCS